MSGKKRELGKRKRPKGSREVARVRHGELVEKAGRWLRRKMGCTAVLLEASYGGTSEVPDAIGFVQSGGHPAYSIVIECKTNRADFLKDKAKAFRQRDSYGQDSGMGIERYYLAPRGMLEKAELPHGWGLLEYAGGRIYVELAPMFKAQTASQVRQELQLLVGALSLVQCGENNWEPRTGTKHSAHNLGPAGRS